MKYTFAYLFTLLAFQTYQSKAQWQELSHNIPSSAFWYIGFEFINDSTGFICDTEGHIFRSTDCGVNWLEVGYNSTPILADISFGDPNIGFVSGSNNIVMRTTDGGSTWFTIGLDVGPYESFGSVHAYDANLTFVSGSVHIWKTNDGGVVWDMVPNLGSNNSVYFATDSIGYACGGTNITKSVDQSNTWSTVYNGTAGNTLWRLRFVSPMEGIAVGDNGTIVKTTDGGITWQQKVSGVSTRLYDIEYFSSTVVYANGVSGVILKSIDAGETWSQETVNPQNFENYSRITVKPNGSVLMSSQSTIVYIDTCGATYSYFGALDPDSICVDDNPIMLTSGLPSGGIYSGPGVSSNSSGYQFDPSGLGIGSYIIYYSVANAKGCWATDSALIKVIDSPFCLTGVAENGYYGFDMYPNPSNDMVNISLPQDVTQGQLYIIDQLGKTIYDTNISGASINLDVSHLSKGIYSVSIQTSDKRFQEKLVIQ